MNGLESFPTNYVGLTDNAEGVRLGRKLYGRVKNDFDPKSIPGLKYWVTTRYPTMFQNLNSLTNPAVNDGDPVGTWQDLSGSNVHVSGNTNAQRPTLITTPSGWKGVMADGVDDMMLAVNRSFVNFLHNNQGTIFVVARPSQDNAKDTHIFILGNNGTGNTGFHFLHHSYAPYSWSYIVYTSGASKIINNFGTSQLDQYTLLTALVNINDTVQRKKAEFVLNKNNINPTSTNNQNPAYSEFSQGNSTYPFGLFSAGNDAAYITGKQTVICEILIYNRKLDSKELSYVNNNLALLYNLNI